jgi:hypothetical protein
LFHFRNKTSEFVEKSLKDAHNSTMNGPQQQLDPLLKQLLQCVQATLLRVGLMEDRAPREEALRKHLAAISRAMIEASALLEQASEENQS